MTVVRIRRVENVAALEPEWRDLERRSDGSFFQSWTWTGCMAAERFADAVLVEATEDRRTVALALFNRGRRLLGPTVLHLGESGSAELDCPYIEQNGVLTEAGRTGELTELCLRAVVSRSDVIMSGIGEPMLAAVRRAADLVLVGRTQASPFVDLAAVRTSGGGYLAGLSPSTRQQIRRSDRFYQQYGPILIERAASVGAAHAMLDEMAALHQAAWNIRGQPGSFARPFFLRFHRALIDAAMPREEAVLLKISCNDTVIGILYNISHRGRMLAYQSGFAYSAGEPRAKPGMTCHSRAIQLALDQELDVYDFLAGEDRYKVSLTNRSHPLVWAEAGPFWSPRLLIQRGLRYFGKAR